MIGKCSIVERMAVRDEDFESGLTLVEGDDGIWSSPEAAPASSPRDWRSEYEREHARAERERARADAAEARCEELRWAEVDSRARAGSLKWQLDRSRSKCQRRSKSTPLAGVKMHHLMRFSPALAVVPVVHRRDPRCFV